MKVQVCLFAAGALLLVWTGASLARQPEAAAPDPLTVRIDLQRTAAPVSRYLYGGFIEHIGTLIYRSLWSEMTDDRKFYFPISSRDTEQPNSASARRGRAPIRK